MVKNLFKSKIS